MLGEVAVPNVIERLFWVDSDRHVFEQNIYCPLEAWTLLGCAALRFELIE